MVTVTEAVSTLVIVMLLTLRCVLAAGAESIVTSVRPFVVVAVAPAVVVVVVRST